jgi:DNA-directed RNA polymerase
MVPAIADWLENHEARALGRGRVGTAIKEYNRIKTWVEPVTIAHIALSVILDKLGRGTSLGAKINNVQVAIGQQLEHEALLSYMNDCDPDYFKKLQKWYLHDPVRRYDKKIRACVHAHNRHDDMKWTFLSTKEHVSLGALLLQAVMSIKVDANTMEGLFETRFPVIDDPNKPHKRKGHKDARYLGFTKAGIKYRDKLQQWCDEDSAKPRPMVCEPLDWTPTQRGGYLTHVNFNTSKLVHGNTGSEPSQLVYDAINRLQKVPFRVNNYILKLMELLLKKTWEIGSFRSFEKESHRDEHFPIVDSDWLDSLSTDSQEYKDTMRKLTEAYHNQKIDEQKAEPVRRTVGIAKEFRDEKFWFPWFLDRRGRLYPSVTGFSPQGADYGKALLRSADGAPLTEDTRRDLLISIATAGAFEGVDKADFFTRLRWGEQFVSTERFKAMVEEPYTVQDWMEADEPFGFLALCEEYYRCFISHEENEGMSPDRVYVFFGRDQTCSGVQILSAVIKDPKAAYFTNVVVTEAPQDLYGEVAKEAKGLMRNKAWLQEQMDAREKKRNALNKKRKPDNQIEPRWVVDVDPEIHDRKVNKTQAMTCGYGATIRTRYGNIKEALIEKQKKGTIPDIHPGDINIVCKAGVDGMGVAFPAYMELNKWFKKLAAAALAEGVERITWTTPAGMFVSQEYRETKLARVQTHAAGGQHYANVSLSDSYIETGEGEPKLSKNQSAIAANFVHSLDGAVITLGVLNTPEDVQLFTIHDCIFVLSGYFGQTIPQFRKAMYNVVTSPVLEELLESNGLTGKVELPPMGELDLEQIKESPYLFC